MSLPRRYKAEASQDIPALPSSWTFLLHCLHCILDGTFLMCNVLLSGGRGNGINWTDCELAKRCSTFHTFGCLSGIRLAAVPARGTEEKRGATLDLPCQWWPSEGSLGALACSPEGAAGPCRAWSCCGFTDICVQKCLWPRLHGDSWVQTREKRGGQQGQGHLWARKPSGVAVGRSCPAGEVRT